LSAAAKRFCISAATCLARSMSCAAALAAIEVSTRAKPTRPQVARESFIAISWSSRANAPPPHYRQQCCRSIAGAGGVCEQPRVDAAFATSAAAPRRSAYTSACTAGHELARAFASNSRPE
jgi:hypothetical protein